MSRVFAKLLAVVFVLAFVFPAASLAVAQEDTIQEDTAVDEQYLEGQQEAENGSAEQSDAECPGATEVASESVAVDESGAQTAPFDISGDRFRVTLTVTEADPGEFPIAIAGIVDDSTDLQQDSVSRETEGTSSIIVNEAPGTFYFDLSSQNAAYTVTAEDCAGGSGDGEGASGGDGGDASNDAGDNIPDDVIVTTIPAKSLANTGGASLLLLLSALMVAAGVLGFAVLRART